MLTYQNPFYSAKYQDSKLDIEIKSTPVEYKGYLIYHRYKSHTAGGNIFDIVKDGICIGMNAGLNWAKKRIDLKNIL